MHAVLLAAALALVQSTDLASDARVDGWTSDLDHWLAALEREHYVFRESGLPEALAARADRLRERIPEVSDQRILVELQGCASLAGDGHTYVLPFAPRVETTGLPLQLYCFSDGVFVIGAEPGHERWIGSEVVAIGATPAKELPSVSRPRSSSSTCATTTAGTRTSSRRSSTCSRRSRPRVPMRGWSS